MKQFDLHFYTERPCNLFVNGEMIGLIDNIECFFIDITSFSDQLIITCEPLSENNEVLLPYSFRLNYKNNTLTSTSCNTTIVPFPDNNYDIILDFKNMIVNSSSTIISKKIDNYTILSMLDSVSTISIFLDDKNLYTCKCAQLSTPEYEKAGTLIVIKAKSLNKTFVLIFDTKNNNAIISGTFESIEKTDEHIKLLKSENCALLTGTVTCLNTKNYEIEKYNVYLDNYTQTHEKDLVPFEFLEAIKDGNYNLASSYLDSNMAHTPAKLKQYFGVISKIYYNCYNHKDNVSNYTIKSDNYRNYDFYIKNNKIIEIEENQLF